MPTCGACGRPTDGLQGTFGHDGPVWLCSGCWKRKVVLPGISRWNRDAAQAFRRSRKRAPVPPAEHQLGGQQAGEVH